MASSLPTPSGTSPVGVGSFEGLAAVSWLRWRTGSARTRSASGDRGDHGHRQWSRPFACHSEGPSGRTAAVRSDRVTQPSASGRTARSCGSRLIRRHRRGPCCRRTPRAGAGVGDVAERGGRKEPLCGLATRWLRGRTGTDGPRYRVGEPDLCGRAWHAARLRRVRCRRPALLDVYDVYRVSAVKVYDAGDRVAVRARVATRSKGIDVPIDAERGYVFDLRHGKVTRFAWFNDPAEALEAVGLAE